MVVAFFRTVIIYIIITFIMRFSGKRQLGELQISELVVTILISELAAIPMQDFNAPVFRSVVSMLTLISLEIIVSFATIKSVRFRGALEGHPCILIENGKVNQKQLQTVRFSLDDLIESIRQKGYMDIDEVNFAILETSGKISIFPKTENAPLTPKDISLQTNNKSLPITIISDGKIINENMDKIHLSLDLLNKIIKKQGYKNVKEIFYMSMDKQKNFKLIRKEKK